MRLYRFSFPGCRFAATVSAILLVVFVAGPQLTHATTADVDSLVPENQTSLIASDNSALIEYALGSHNGLEARGSPDGDDEGPLGLEVIRRAPPDVSPLANNQFQRDDIKIGETQWWYFPRDQVRGKKSNVTSGLPANLTAEGAAMDESGNQGDDKSVYITLTTCQKPNTTSTNDAGDLPQLELYVSKSEQRPGPGKNDQQGISEEGYLSLTVQADDDVYIGVSAPNATTYSGVYKYQIAASIDTYFHNIQPGPFLYFVDSDVNSALLTTGNVTEATSDMDNWHQWMNTQPPYTMFAYEIDNPAITGLQQAYCALEQNAQVKRSTHNIESEMTSRGLGHKPKEQFFIKGLNESSTYLGVLAMEGNSSASGNKVVGGGGKIWQPMNFTTKADGNCAIIFGLSFCSEVAYAVPSNPSFDDAQLKSLYDDYAASKFQNFSYSLQQNQCNTTAENMYSLAVNCDNCSQAYKEWLCSVTIPRCEDYSSSDDFLQPRNAGQKFFNGTSLEAGSPDQKLAASNRSRSSMIDEQIQPGPYKEVLPCQDVCHNLVRSCPASLEFGCPQGTLLRLSYGQRSPNGDVTCNYMGAAYYLNAGRSIHGGLWLVLYALGVFWVLSWAYV